jgi:hypothetical protein
MSLMGFQRRRRELANKKVENKPNYESLSVDDLKIIAKEKGIKGYQNMKKETLIASLTGGEADDTGADSSGAGQDQAIGNDAGGAK